MASYKRVYCKFFSYYEDEDEFISSEISGQRAADIHHIFPKQMGGKKSFVRDGKTYSIDCIQNLIALTRDEHTDAHAEKYTKDELWEIHRKKMAIEINIGKSRIQ